MELNLTRPIAIFDLETTGINVSSDRIIEISVVKVMPDGTESWYTKRVNPEMPIGESAIAVHGISDDDVKDEPTFKELAHEIAEFLEGCDLSGYNAIKFDIPVLAEEFLRADVDFDLRKSRYIDEQVIFHKMEQRTLAAAYKFYCDKSLDNAHSAEADTAATYEILKAQLDRYENLTNDVEKLSEFSSYNKNADLAGRIIYNKDDLEVFNFGKHKGRLVEEILKEEPGYFAWMIKGDFPLYTKKILTEIRLRSFNQK